MNYFYKKLLANGKYQYEARSAPISGNSLIRITKDEYISALHALLLESLQELYNNSEITAEQLAEMVTNGEITQAEYDQITAQ
ncbi:MAG TPA: SHOCT domain-containing protein [Clostridia bacterium]|nr:SHOCT domain-containing protein [Clostridia bacterium]